MNIDYELLYLRTLCFVAMMRFIEALVLILVHFQHVEN